MPGIISAPLPRELDKLSEELVEYQLMQNEDISQEVWKEAAITDDHEGTVYRRMDIIWHHISSMKAADGSLRFPQLSCVAKLVLVILHSNAQEKRMFSMVRKNKTAFRPSLDPKELFPVF